MRRQHSPSQYLAQDTIAALSSQVGGAIAVIRVSGGDAFSILGRVTRSRSTVQAELKKMTRSPFFGEDPTHPQILDDVLFVRFQNPHSYTGEDLVEFHVHGSSFLAHRVLEVLLKQGARQALPGEFSFRAVRNGKMSVFQAQAVADLLSATNDQAAYLATEKLSGLQNHFLENLSRQLKRIATLSEVGIDFSDQDIDEVSLPNIKMQLGPIFEFLRRLKESYQRGSRLQEGVRVAFVGLPNAGKSSFFNALLGQDRSIVSELAGTTRDVIHEKMTLTGTSSTVTLRLEDTAGLRMTDNLVEKIGIERTFASARTADLILLIVDCTTDTASILDQWAALGSLNSKTIGVFTKSDLVDDKMIAHARQALSPLGIRTWTLTSAQSGFGIEQTVDAIVAFCEQWTQRTPGELVITRVDHSNAVSLALAHLDRAEAASEIDLFASDVRQALHALAPLIGEMLPDDILGDIFSNFCIGK